MLMNFNSVPRTLGGWEPKKFTGEDEESILNHTITGLLLSAGQTNPQETLVQEKSHILQKKIEQSNENTDSALSTEEEEEKNTVSADHSTTEPLCVPMQKLYRQPQIHIFNKGRYV